jgi:3-hydroxyisobutyrate dehydrogenase-like beta-hydroxyacid dehydrogenase
MKLAANVLTATTLECMGEVLGLLRKGGVGRHLAYDVLKDLRLALAEAERAAVPMQRASSTIVSSE